METQRTPRRPGTRTKRFQEQLARITTAIRSRIALGPNDLLRDAIYRRLWISVLASSFGAQIALLALPLTAAVLLHASATEMGILTGMETLPFVIFSLPSGVWLDRVRKLPVYIAGELTLACAAASVPIAWWTHTLSIGWLFIVAFIIGLVNTTAGSASQIVLTQIVARDRLIEANAKNALASSGAEVAGPGIAGVLIKLLGAPLALLFNAALLLLSAVILSGIEIEEEPSRVGAGFWPELKAGLDFVRTNHLLVVLAGFVAAWQLCYNSALVVNILFATRTLGMSGQSVGLSYVCLGLGTVLASLFGGHISRRLGPGMCLTLGFGLSSAGSLILAAAPIGPLGQAMFALDLMLFGFGAVLIFVNFISLRQAVTSAPMLGRMTSTMRWLILIPAGPGALVGGWLGEHAGLRTSLEFAGIGGALLTIAAWRSPVLRAIKALPVMDGSDASLTSELMHP
jgi:MFS family permease